MTHPLWLGEFGTCNTNPSCYSENSNVGGDSEDSVLESNGRLPLAGEGWWSNVHQYLNETGMGWSYWAVDGTESTGSGRKFGAPESFGILNTTWSGPSADGLLKSIQHLMN